MSHPDKVAELYLKLRPVSRIVKRVNFSEYRTNLPNAVLLDDLHCYEIRSLLGDTFCARIGGKQFIFVDQVCLEHALDFYDIAHSPQLEFGKPSVFLDAIRHKQMARALFVCGYSFGAYTAMIMGRDMEPSIRY